MRFSRFKYLYLFISLLLATSFYGITYGYYQGFARSLTFDGGIRFSIRLPAGMGKEELLKAAEENGLTGAKVRLTNLRSNVWDLELGPQIGDKIEKQLEAQKAQPKQPASKEQPAPSTPSAAALKEQLTPPVQSTQPVQLAQPAQPASTEKEADKGETDKGEAGKGETDKGEIGKGEIGKGEVDVTGYIESLLRPALNISAENIVSRETIAASYGANLSGLALQIIIYAIIAIGIYLTFRFDFPFAVGASFALVHDLLLTVGFIGLLQIEPSIPVLAAVLTIIGYSINDTIVIFDRVRENSEGREQATLEATINLSITQTLPRTSITSVLTMLAVLALLIGGEASLRDFAVVLLFGVLVGTYSSICVAVPIVQIYEQFRHRRPKSQT